MVSSFKHAAAELAKGKPKQAVFLMLTEELGPQDAYFAVCGGAILHKPFHDPPAPPKPIPCGDCFGTAKQHHPMCPSLGGANA
jgi:hypothetical protein